MDEDWQIGYDDGYAQYAHDPKYAGSDSYDYGYRQGCSDRETEDEEAARELEDENS